MLVTVGWGKDYRNEGFGESSGMKYQLVQLVTSVRTLLRGITCNYDGHCYKFLFSSTVPLMIVNILVILYELLLG